MKHQQPNARAAGLREALDFVRMRYESLRDLAERVRKAEGNSAHAVAREDAAYSVGSLIDGLSDQLLDAGGFLGDAPEPTEDRITVRGWTVCLPDTDSYTEQTGWFEYDKDGTGGGLWFEDATLVDYDGVSCIPAAVVEGIRQLGFIVPADME